MFATRGSLRRRKLLYAVAAAALVPAAWHAYAVGPGCLETDHPGSLHVGLYDQWLQAAGQRVYDLPAGHYRYIPVSRASSPQGMFVYSWDSQAKSAGLTWPIVMMFEDRKGQLCIIERPLTMISGELLKVRASPDGHYLAAESCDPHRHDKGKLPDNVTMTLVDVQTGKVIWHCPVRIPMYYDEPASLACGVSGTVYFYPEGLGALQSGEVMGLSRTGGLTKLGTYDAFACTRRGDFGFLVQNESHRVHVLARRLDAPGAPSEMYCYGFGSLQNFARTFPFEPHYAFSAPCMSADGEWLVVEGRDYDFGLRPVSITWHAHQRIPYYVRLMPPGRRSSFGRHPLSYSSS